MFYCQRYLIPLNLLSKRKMNYSEYIINLLSKKIPHRLKEMFQYLVYLQILIKVHFLISLHSKEPLIHHLILLFLYHQKNQQQISIKNLK